MSELRWHPFLRQWVITATHRQDRTYHPPPDFNPLAPTKPGGFETEIPFADYDIAVFENRFPSLQSPAPDPAIERMGVCEIAPSEGVCEVVCYTPDPEASVGTMPLQQVRKLVRVWRHRYEALGAREDVDYVLIFENKGNEIGVTLSHPHGQIYGYPFVPPRPGTALEAASDQEGSLWDDWLEMEIADGRRIVDRNDFFVTLVPFFARWPYEIHVVSTHPVDSLLSLSPEGLDRFADAIHKSARRLDALFGFSMPYVMAMYQRPTCDGDWNDRLRVEFYPPYRTAEKLKYLAGSEAAADVFINDTLPEDSAEKLRNAL